MLEQIIAELKRYIEWEEDFDFTGWEDIEIFIGNTLSEAWIKAHPHDKKRFDDPRFRNMVDSSKGEWLEKQNPDDSYKVLISTEYSTDPAKLAITLAHELRHALDYQKAVEHLSFDEYQPGNQYYNHWSEFRAASVSVRFEFYQMMTSMRDKKPSTIFSILTRILGFWSADCIEGIMGASNEHRILYFLIRYIGAARAIRNLNIKYGICDSLDSHYMTPLYIHEHFGHVSDTGKELDELDLCQLDEPDGDNHRFTLGQVSAFYHIYKDN